MSGVAFRASGRRSRCGSLLALLLKKLGGLPPIGNKGASAYLDCGTASGPSLEKDIATITGIPERVLRNYATSADISVEEKLRWMEGRITTEPEDMSYALYGIFGVTPGANYGERHEGARQRLLAAIHHRDNLTAQRADRFQTIAAWLSPPDP